MKEIEQDVFEEYIKSLPTNLIKTFIHKASREINERKKAENISLRRDFIKTLKEKKYSKAYEKEMRIVWWHNSKNILSLPDLAKPLRERTKYLKYIFEQDWSDVYPSDNDKGEYYVYCHVNPSARILNIGKQYGGNYGGEPFYVGKGIGNRAYDLKRNQGHGKMIKKLLSDGWESDDIVKIIFKGLSEQKALELESKLIYCFGSIYEKDRLHTVLYNLDIPKKPEFEGKMKKIPFKNECPDE